MILTRRAALAALVGVAALPSALTASQSAPPPVLRDWYRLVLELVRHTATYSPPVASRAFAYVGVTAFEAVAGGDPALVSLAGQLNGLTPVPARDPALAYDEALVLTAALEEAVGNFFGNTGPSGQQAMARMASRKRARLSEGVEAEVAARSLAHGKAVADHILAWSQTDGGAVVENMGFPYDYTPQPGPEHWVPTSTIRQQQAPLLPNWGTNRTFAMPTGATCALTAPPAYSEAPGSAFYAEAMEVYETVNGLTPEQKAIARFWSDDPMLSPTPPGHWVSIACQILEAQGQPESRCAEVLALVGIAVADGFIGCWQAKYEYDLVRPVTYIKRVIDPKWEPLLITPPFPEYPSGHSTQSGAAAEVLTTIFGPGFAFSDATHEADGIAPRSFPDFWAAADEAAISRLYGGIHYRAAIDRGLEQGRCIGAYAAALKTRA